MKSSDAAAVSGPLFSPCLTLFMDPSQLCTEVTWLKETKTVSVRADLDMVAYLPNGLLFSIVCWQQQFQISDSLADPFFNPVLHNVHLATTRWARSFPIQWTTTWTGELSKTLAEILHQRIWYSSVNLPWYPIKCIAWTCFTLFYHVLTISGGANLLLNEKFERDFALVMPSCRTQYSVGHRNAKPQYNSMQPVGETIFYPLSNQRNSPPFWVYVIIEQTWR